jgi:hypothetical protein
MALSMKRGRRKRSFRSRGAVPKVEFLSTFAGIASARLLCRFPPFEKAEENDVGEA